MGITLFILKFAIGTTALFLGLTLIMWAFGRINVPSLTFGATAHGLAGSHLGRLRFLFVAAAVSFVLTFVFPGPALLFDLPQTLEPARKAWYHIMYGNNASQHYTPPAPSEQGSWFWAQAFLIYVGTFVLYVLLVIPEMLRSAIRAAAEARTRRQASRGSSAAGGPVPKSAWAELLLVAAGTFIGAFLSQLWNRNRSA